MKTLERRLVDTLRSEAERLPDEVAAYTVPPLESRRTEALRPGLAAPAAVVAVMILAAPVIWLSAGRGGGGESPATTPTTQPAMTESTQPATTPPANAQVFGGLLGSVVDVLPNGFDPAVAIPILVSDGSPKDAAIRYLATRNVTTSVGITQVEEQPGYTLVGWAWGRLLDESEPEQGERGWILMRPSNGNFEVIAATTNSVDLSDVTVTDGRLRGNVTSGSGQQMGVDVLNLDETPVAAAPHPEGMPDADFLWGTAGAGESPMTLDFPVAEPFIFRVNLVGGALLSISEVIFGQSADAPSDEEPVQEPATHIEYETDPAGFEALLGDGDTFLGGGYLNGDPWAIVGRSLAAEGKPTLECSGVRPIIDEDVCDDLEGLGWMALPIGDTGGGVLVVRSSEDADVARINYEDGTAVEAPFVGSVDGYPPVAVVPIEAPGISGTIHAITENGDVLWSEPFTVTEIVNPGG
ncbi:MAG TPA: hypothetical protein VJ935_00860 [Acidimicrobiia bacterium]|nr:hypothetical protein [Acidimicrobiia bacterium]